MNQTLPPTSSSLVAGKYQLVRCIGQGGMGSVWEGRHASLGTRVAIKFIEADYADNGEARSRFDREARAAASLQSKHAIQIFDHGVTEDGKPYIVMEMLLGEPLDKRIQRLGQLPLQDTTRILQQVGRALAQAHEKGIVHRDLKPENIFLVASPDDDDEIAKVLDFGIAKIQGDGSPGLTSSTKTGAVLGTPYYMSPEQARGLRNVDHRTDIWSLGVIAFRAVTGRLPFEGESVGDLLVKICTSPVPIPSEILPGLPPAFDTWFLRALDRDPTRRFASVPEAMDALAFAAGVTVRGRGSQAAPVPSAVPTPATQVPAQVPLQVPDAASAAFGSGGTAAPFTANAIESPIPTAGGPRGLWIGGAIAAVAVVVLGVVGVLVVKKRDSGSNGATTVLSATAPLPETSPSTSTGLALQPLVSASTPVPTLPTLSTQGTPTNPPATNPVHAGLAPQRGTAPTGKPTGKTPEPPKTAIPVLPTPPTPPTQPPPPQPPPPKPHAPDQAGY